MKRLLLVLIFGRLAVASVEAQVNLAGRVTDEFEQPLSNAMLTIRGTKAGTRTLQDGRFSLPTNTDLPLTLTVSLMGYRSREILVRGNNFRSIAVELKTRAVVKDSSIASQQNEVVVATNRIPVALARAPVTVEKFSRRQFEQSAALVPFDALQNAKGVDFQTQSFLFKSINARGFGANDNARFLQLTDGMDNRSPSLGYGFGNVAGLPDLDVDNIELVPGASSTLYGPDAVQGLLSTTSKNPFVHQGLSVQLKGGVNNVGKADFGAKGFLDVGVRYAQQVSDYLAFKVSFQHLSATDFIADDYSDRQTRARTNFLATDPSRGNVATGLGYVPNNNANANFQYDGVNIYGDEINGNGSSFTFPTNYANVLLRSKLVTRTGYNEIDLLGNQGKVFSNRANVSLHYKLFDDVEASVGWYYGNGNFIRTANFREYFPNYHRHQFKAEVRGSNFFLRAYTTQQKTDAWNIGQIAPIINSSWKSLGQWAAEFGQVYIENKFSVGDSRATADRGRHLPGSAQFDAIRNAFANTYNTDSVPGYRGAPGARLRDNSALWHYEGMVNLTNLAELAEIIVGGNLRRYALNTGGTLVALNADKKEYTINEFGAYVQVAKELSLGEALLKPTASLRYDKNQYVQGTLSPRASAVLSIGPHNFRASWQTAFHNPTPVQLFAVPTVGRLGEVGGLLTVAESAGLVVNPAYSETDVRDFLGKRLTEGQLQNRVYTPHQFRAEKLKTWEVGYRSVIGDKLSIDTYYFNSQYIDFITSQTFYQPTNNRVADLSAGTYRTLQINRNSPNDIFVNGWAIGGEYTLIRNFTLTGNYTYQVGMITLRDAQGNVLNDNAGVPIIKRSMSAPEVIQKGRNYFNSPENRFNISLSNPHLTDQLGATVTYRWTDKMWYEQGLTAGDVWLPAWASLDAQVSYRVPAYKSLIKLGGTNLLNKYYAQGYGLAQIGGLYYVSITFDELMR